MKNQGYHLEYNFGHGKENLSMTLFTLNIIAFLMHQVMEMTEKTYIKFLETRRKCRFYEDFCSAVNWIVFDTFEDLFKAITKQVIYKLVPI